jgi:hypothetical protein
VGTVVAKNPTTGIKKQGTQVNDGEADPIEDSLK